MDETTWEQDREWDGYDQARADILLTNKQKRETIMESLNDYMLDNGDDTRLIITVRGDKYEAELIDSQAKRRVLYRAESDDLATVIRLIDDQVYTDMVTP